MNRREAIIEAARQWWANENMHTGRLNPMDEILADFHLAQNPWVPVEDGLPEEDGPYLVTHQFSDGTLYAGMAWHGSNRDSMWVDNRNREMMTVIAWKRLDEPYQP